MGASRSQWIVADNKTTTNKAPWSNCYLLHCIYNLNRCNMFFYSKSTLLAFYCQFLVPVLLPRTDHSRQYEWRTQLDVIAIFRITCSGIRLERVPRSILISAVAKRLWFLPLRRYIGQQIWIETDNTMTKDAWIDRHLRYLNGNSIAAKSKSTNL